MATAVEMSDREEVARAASEGRSVDPEVSKRVRERAAKAREELRKTYGVLDIAVGLIREVREE
jgi:hypothetical protein